MVMAQIRLEVQINGEHCGIHCPYKEDKDKQHYCSLFNQFVTTDTNRYPTRTPNCQKLAYYSQPKPIKIRVEDPDRSLAGWSEIILRKT